MANTDNKILNGAGVEKLSQLVKDAIASGSGSSYTFTNGLTESSGTVSRDETYSVDKLIDRIVNPGSASSPSVDGLFKATTQDEFWQGIQSGKWFIRNSGLVFSAQMVSDLANDYGITHFVTKVASDSASTGTISANWTPQPSWFPVLVKRTATEIYSIPYGTMNYSAMPWGQIEVNYDNATSKWLQDWIKTFKDGIAEVDGKIPSLATTSTAGIVIPDGTSITVDSNGVISANAAAADIEYDNTNSHMQATDIQSAIDYLAANSGSGGTDLPADPTVDGSYKLINTVGTNGGLSWEVNTAVPTKTSDLTNDSGFITSSSLPTKTSDLTNDSGFITSVPLATNNAAGAVKPDGTSITVDANGVISAAGGGGGASYTATNGIQIDNNNVIKPGIDIKKAGMPLVLALSSYLSGNTRGNNFVNAKFLNNIWCKTIADVKESLELYGSFVTPYSSSLMSYTWEDILNVLGLDTSVSYSYAYILVYTNSTDGQYITADSLSPIKLSNKPDSDKIYFYVNNGTNNIFYCVPAGYSTSLPISANGRVDMRDTTLTGMRYPTINRALIAFQNTRPPAALVSTDTAPTIEGAINWVYA